MPSITLVNPTFPQELSTRDGLAFMPSTSNLGYSVETLTKDGIGWIAPNIIYYGIKAILTIAFDIFITTPYLIYENRRIKHQIRNLDLKLERMDDMQSIRKDLFEIATEITSKANGNIQELQQLILAYATDKCFIDSLAPEMKNERQARMANLIGEAVITTFAMQYVDEQYERNEYLFNCGIHNIKAKIKEVAINFTDEKQIRSIFLQVLKHKQETTDHLNQDNALIAIGNARYESMSDGDKNKAERDHTWLFAHAHNQVTFQNLRLARFLAGQRFNEVREENALIKEPLSETSLFQDLREGGVRCESVSHSG